jgi:ComF family protein
MTIKKLLLDIFFINEKNIEEFWIPKNLTKHYKNECVPMYFDEVCVGGQYAFLKKDIERYKYQSDRQLSTRLVDVLAKCVEVSNLYQVNSDWVFIPVPMHWMRYFQRGFHHTERLSTELSNKIWWTHISLLQTKWTKRQAKLSRWDRLKNKKNSFFVKSWYTVPSHIILIDDVISSWSTLNEAAKVLRESWAKVVLCFTLASNA